jgi:Uma2 family endonuclease
MLKSATTIGPADRNRRMSLAEFDHAEAQEGYLYELSRGVIIVSDVPDPRHLAQVDEITQQLADYRRRHHGVIHRVAGGSDCKILLRDLESERHPDIAVYKTPPPRNGDLWASWKPELVIEVVSPGSEERDYVWKRGEYLDFGVREYWIVDHQRREVLVLRRRGPQWTERIVTDSERCTTRSLPGFELDVAAVFREADRAA